MSVASLDEAVAPYSPRWAGVLFATHRRVAVRAQDGTAGPEFCTCGDVWPCRSEERAARMLDLPAAVPAAAALVASAPAPVVGTGTDTD